jgi:hypothetical protein
MRLIVCLIALLCGCSTPTIRCDAHLQPINRPAPGSAAAAAAARAPSAAAQTHAARRAP